MGGEWCGGSCAYGNGGCEDLYPASTHQLPYWQTLLVVSGGVVKAIYHISTGSGQRYYSRGAWRTATTPTGSYHVFRSVRGWDRGPLGSLYRPAYFSGGFAVHGALSVPPWPASHGCARVAVAAMDHLWASGSIRVGSPVRVY